MKKTLLLFAALAAVQLVCAQALRSRGPVPADLKMSVQQLYDTDVQRAEQYAGRRVRDRQQLLEASYRINKMLAGAILSMATPSASLPLALPTHSSRTTPNCVPNYVSTPSPAPLSMLSPPPRA